MMKKIISAGLILSVFIYGCSKDDNKDPINISNNPYDNKVFSPTPVDLNSELPGYIPRMEFPVDNPSTKEGIELGRHLFYEKKLSRDNSISCGSCHIQANGFSDPDATSLGVDGKRGTRNAMHLVNLGLHFVFFWDGRVNTLEKQAIEPILNKVEMHSNWAIGMAKLNADKKYRDMSFAAFGVATLDSINATKAIAQFVRSLISNNSKFDRFMADQVANPLTAEELHGRDLFLRDRIMIGPEVRPGADCFHCHPISNDFTDNLFHNNGLDAHPQDSGRAAVTGNAFDMGKFKAPSLRNLKYTAPYMHDGRFNTLDEVIDFYSEGLQHSPTIDPLMKNVDIGGVRLDAKDKAALKAFLLTLSDDDFVNNPDFSDPNE